MSAKTASPSEMLRVGDDRGQGFLGSLAPSIFPRYPYRGRVQFENDFNHAFRTINDTNIEWFVASDVDDETFTTEFRNAEEAPFSRWCAYDRTLNLLLVRIVRLKAHESAAAVFDYVFVQSLMASGMDLSIDPIGASTHFASIGAKEPDKAWLPIRLPRGQLDKWPTLALEVAYSETRSKLPSDVQ